MAQKTQIPEDLQLLTPEQAAVALGVSVNTLKDWRKKHCGPRYGVQGKRAIRYRLSDLRQYQDSSVVWVDPLHP